MDTTLQFDDTNRHNEHSRYHCHRPRWSYLKWGETPSYLHKDQWREFLTCYNRKRVLRVAKIVLSRYNTKSINSNAYSKEILVPSYWIKTV